MSGVLFCLVPMLLLQLLTPYWWWVMIVPFAYGISIARSGGRAFRTGLLSAGLLWLGWAIILFLSGSRTIAGRMADMVGLGHSWLMIVVTAVIGAGAAAVSGYAGYSVRTLFKNKRLSP